MSPLLAGPDDAPGIAAIWNHYIRDTVVTFTDAEKGEDEVRALVETRANAGHATFVLREAGEVTGFASYAQFRGGPGYARTLEHTVLLAPGARGGGRGRALLGAVIGHARARGGHSLYAGVSSGNPEGVAFHARIGFESAAVLPEAGWKAGRWWDLHLMRFRL